MNELSDLPQDFLKQGHRIQKAASGTSMLPSIPDGATLQIEPLQEKKIRLGDIVYFLDNEGNTKIHRVSCIIKKGKEMSVQTWGDNCDKPDGVIKRSQILGRVAAIKDGNEWHQPDARFFIYTKHFVTRYVRYYLGRIPTKILNALNRQT